MSTPTSTQITSVQTFEIHQYLTTSSYAIILNLIFVFSLTPYERMVSLRTLYLLIDYKVGDHQDLMAQIS